MAGGAPFDLRRTFVDIAGDGATAIDVTETFWADLASGARRIDGFLMGRFAMSESPAHWEIHPKGDEIFHLVSGAIEVVLEEQAGERRVTLAPGESFIVPRGTWHRIEVREPGEMLFITYGEGTDHKPVEPV